MSTKHTPASADLAQVGKKAPAWTLRDQHGVSHKLSDYKGKWVVLFFYPRDNTPGCTKEACSFRDHNTTLQDHGAVVFGISPDTEASHKKFADKFELPFTLLADTEKKVCQKYGVWQEKNLYGRKSMGVVRTTYLIDPTGKVAHRWDKVKVAGHVEDVLAQLTARIGA